MARRGFYKSFVGVQGVVFQKNPLVAEGIGAQDGQAESFIIFFRFSAHPEYGLVDPHGGHQFFQSARAVREFGKNSCVSYHALWFNNIPV